MLFVVVPVAILLNFVSLALLAIIYLARAPNETSKSESIAALFVSILGFLDAAAIVPLSFRVLAGVSVPGFSGSVLSAPSELVRLIVMSAWVGLAISAVRARSVGALSLFHFPVRPPFSLPPFVAVGPSGSCVGRAAGKPAGGGRPPRSRAGRVLLASATAGTDREVPCRRALAITRLLPSHPATAETEHWQR